MHNLKLCKMTMDLARRFYRGFETDPALFMDMSQFRPYVYSEDWVEAHFRRQIDRNREYLAVMLENAPVGEIILKDRDPKNRCCTLSIHLKNNSVKNRGYGTQAEILALEYAFNELGMETVYANAVHTNLRSRHVLEKVGFVETHTNETFRYYRCDRSNWKRPELDSANARLESPQAAEPSQTAKSPPGPLT